MKERRKPECQTKLPKTSFTKMPQTYTNKGRNEQWDILR